MCWNLLLIIKLILYMQGVSHKSKCFLVWPYQSHHLQCFVMKYIDFWYSETLFCHLSELWKIMSLFLKENRASSHKGILWQFNYNGKYEGNPCRKVTWCAMSVWLIVIFLCWIWEFFSAIGTPLHVKVRAKSYGFWTMHDIQCISHEGSL